MTASAVRTGQTARAGFDSLMYPLALRALPTVTVLVVAERLLEMYYWPEPNTAALPGPGSSPPAPEARQAQPGGSSAANGSLSSSCWLPACHWQ